MAEQLELKLQKEKHKKKPAFNRKPYLTLTCLTPGRGLCCYCKFAEWSGDCEDADLDCTHPLDAIRDGDFGEHAYNTWEGGDCWGFRPNATLQEVGVYVGIILEGNIPTTDSKGEIVAIIPSEKEKLWLTP